MCEGINYVMDTIGAGIPVMQDFWDENQRKADPSKQGTKLFYFPAPLEDLAQAYRYIEAHAQAFQVDMEDYAVCGSSAGGHLAAEWGTWYW